MSLERDLAFERAHGGIVARSGDMATLGDGTQAWLNGTRWARAEADAAISAYMHGRHDAVSRVRS